MVPDRATHDAVAGQPRSLFVYNGGFLRQKRLRRILALAGYRVRLGRPAPDDLVGVWGQSPTAHRGVAVARQRNCGVVRIEDAFVRSLHPGRSGDLPLGLHIDHAGVHFDGRTPSDLEHLLATHPLDDSSVLSRARDCIEWMRSSQISKYSACDPERDAPPPGYVLVVDQTRDDASVKASGADRARFVEMLVHAQEEHPGARVLIKTHPETLLGHRPGYFDHRDASHRVSFCTAPLSPWTLLEGAVGVYTVSSQLGFEAILAGHRPRVFGQPFYAGWGLSTDDDAPARRTRTLTRAQLFAAAMILYPTWYDPCRDRLCRLEDVLAQMDAQIRAYKEDRNGWVAYGMRPWKWRPLSQFFGTTRGISFPQVSQKRATRALREGAREMVWASKASADDMRTRIEDGFLRSRGLGADLIPPLSLVSDTTGIYYDPSQPSQLETLIRSRAKLTPGQKIRATKLMAYVTSQKLSKYNLTGEVPDIPAGRKILVPGQVEDDASILKGTSDIRTNSALLQRVRQENPNAILIYKPHPDVVAGLRPGGTCDTTAADLVIKDGDIAALIEQVDEVWTMTSLTGFEALMRGKHVVTYGAPFYAGWGLTRDLGSIPHRRHHAIRIEGLVHATLIDYPRYRDPVTGLPCPVEVIAERLAENRVPAPGPVNRTMARVQGWLSGHAHLWR